MTVPLSDTHPFGVVFDRPDADRSYAWGPFASFDAAARFAEFVEAEIDPARVIPWADAQALPGVRVADPVAELLTWRSSVAATQLTELATAHADALNRGAAVLDQLADAAEANVLAHYNGACGRGSCDMVRESARTLREMAGATTPSSKEKQR